MNRRRTLIAIPLSLVINVVLMTALSSAAPEDSDQPNPSKSVFSKQNLVAWCIVPFDAAKRGPVARARMLRDLGLRRVAYDWREEHVATFEQEILAYREHGLTFFAFWDVHDEMLSLFAKHKIAPQVWKMLADPGEGSQQEKVESVARGLIPLVNRTRDLGCKLGIYNHGGWTGEPINMVAVCKWLRTHADGKHVGIVYNFHHGHEHIDDFPRQFAIMQPYLLCVNLNGMNDHADPKILAVGKGSTSWQ